MTQERRESHAPGTFSTWFAKASAYFPRAITGATDVVARRTLLEERAREEARWAPIQQRHESRVTVARQRVDEVHVLQRDVEAHHAAAECDRLADLAVHD